MKPLRLHTKTAFLVSAITLAMFLATLLLVSVRMVNLVSEDERALARLQAISVAEQISLMPSPRDQDDLERALSQARAARPNVIAVRIWKQTDAGLVARAVADGVATLDSLPVEIQADAAATVGQPKNGLGFGPTRDFSVKQDHATLYRVFAPVTEQGRFYGFVEVSERLEEIPLIVERFAQTAALLALAAIALTLFALFALFRFWVYRPMNDLDEAMARVKDGSLDVRAPVSTQDEFGRLAVGFNRMIERIRELTQEREAQQETLRERVREATAESQAAAERYRLIFDSNPLPMWVCDAATLQFLTVNEAAVQSYGWTREEFLRLTMETVCLPEDRDRLRAILMRPVEEQTHPVEIRHQRQDGSLIDVEMLSHDLSFAGREARLVIAADVTEKKLIELGLMRSQRLEALGTLASGIAHDLNNILSPLSISTYLLRPKVSDAAGQQTLDTMEEVVARGSQLVNQVLSFARGAEGERSPFDPRKVLREVVGILKETFPKSVHVQYHEAKPLGTVLGNSTQLHQVLMNLCVNARDAMPDGGELAIQIEQVELAEHYAHLQPGAQPGPYILLSVRDTGMGIPPQVIDKIFDPFFTTKEQGKGTGLGLSTSLGIVRSHGGFINVQSKPNHGTTINVYLPALPEQRQINAPPAPSASDSLPGRPVERVNEAGATPAGNGELILLVDDEAALRRVTCEMLEAANYRVVLAENGAQAYALYCQKQAEIKLVLTDMMMPLMDGAALIQELLHLNPQLPVIACSGLTDAGKEEQARNLGAHDFLPKPYTAARLLQAVHEALPVDRRLSTTEDK